MLTLFQLWDELLTKFSKEFENPENILEQLKADERLGDRTEPLLRSIQRDLFFLEEFITPETLNTYHYNFCKNQTTGIRTNSRFILEAYTRNLPPNPFTGTWVSYQFPKNGEKLDVTTELGVKEFAATRMFWVIVPTATECRVFGYGANGRRYTGSGKIENNRITAKVKDLSQINRTMRLDLTQDENELKGTQYLTEFNTTRPTQWQKVDKDFIDLRGDKVRCPKLFEKVQDLPEQFKLYIEDVLRINSTGSPATPQYILEKQQLEDRIIKLDEEKEALAASNSQFTTEKETLLEEKETLTAFNSQLTTKKQTLEGERSAALIELGKDENDDLKASVQAVVNAKKELKGEISTALEILGNKDGDLEKLVKEIVGEKKAALQALGNEDGDLEKLTKSLVESEERLKKHRRYGVITAIVLISVLSWCLWTERQNQKSNALWAGLIPENNEKLIKNVGFLKGNSGFLEVVDSLVLSLQKPDLFVNKLVDPVKVVRFDSNISEGFNTFRKDSLIFYPEKLSYQPIPVSSKKDSMERGASYYLGQLFRKYHRDGPVDDPTILSRMFGIKDSRFYIGLVYWGYSKKVQGDSLKVIYRYPAYQGDSVIFQNYDFEKRQWWEEAKSVKEKSGYNHWTWIRTNDTVTCGFTKCYPSKTQKTSKRTFWVEVPQADTNTKLILCIDIHKNIELKSTF